MLERDAEHLASLRDATADALSEAIGPVTDVALVDAPNQINVGDSLIWAGEVAYLRRLGKTVRYVSDLQGYEPHSLRRAMPEGVVLIHGGGNFGDLWLGHQWHREQIVDQLRDYRIVQLPQSIYFRSRERAAEANAKLAGHPDFRVLTRDRVSMTRAEADLPGVRTSFCHDMAFGWAAPSRTVADPQPQRVLALARADKESSSGLATVGRGWLTDCTLEVTDWGELGAERERWDRARRRARLEHRRARASRRLAPLRSTRFQPGLQRALAQINTSNIVAGVGLYDAAAAVITDRLHAHIIAALRGIPHVLLDNSYGKLEAVYDASTSGFSTAHRAADLDAAHEIMRRLLG